MNLPAWNNLVLDNGIVREPVSEAGRVVLWLLGTSNAEAREWLRVSTAARAEVVVQGEFCAAAATAIEAIQPIRGLFGKFFGRFQKSSGSPTWMLPSGESVEQRGERQTDLLLVWPKEGSPSLDEAQLRTSWPNAREYRRLGANLFLVRGIAGPQTVNAPGPAAPPPQANPLQEVKDLLATAQAKGDRRAEAALRTDLGVIAMQSGDAPRAVALLEEALALSRQLGDQKQETDVLCNLGFALIAAGRTPQAHEHLERSVTNARATGDRFAEKLGLTGLGLVFARVGQQEKALALFEQAAALAGEVGDRQNQAELIWYQAVHHAEMGRREQALAKGQATVELLKQMDNPQAAVYAEHLAKYRQSDPGAGIGGPSAFGQAAMMGNPFSWSMTSDVPTTPAPPTGTASGPGLLRMALSLAKSMGKFVGSGMKTVPATLHQQRLQTCATCEHHTGVRCRLCGCYTRAKSWLPHERCPAGKWPG